MRTIGQGDEVPPPIKSFREMKLPEPMLSALEAKGIKRPTPIQVRNEGVRGAGRFLFPDICRVCACVFWLSCFGFAAAVG